MNEKELEEIEKNKLEVGTPPTKKKDPNRPHIQFEITKNPSLTGRRLKFNVLEYFNFSESQKKKHKYALGIGEIVVNSKEYRDWVLSERFTTTKLNSSQIYDKQMTGEESLQKGKDYTLEMKLTMYEENNSTVGYTKASTVMVWVNNKFFKIYTPGQIFKNFWHEGQHKYGFDHASAKDHNSVPYKCGFKVEEMVNAYEKGVRYTDLYPEAVETVIVPVPPTVENPTPEPIKVPVPVKPKQPVKVCSRPWYYLGLITVCKYE